jgi:predicted peptidase
MGYLEYLPPGYEESQEKYPVLIFLHGGGEGGNGSPEQLEKVKAWGPPRLIELGHKMCFTVDDKQECFIVISPQIMSGTYL